MGDPRHANARGYMWTHVDFGICGELLVLENLTYTLSICIYDTRNKLEMQATRRPSMLGTKG